MGYGRSPRKNFDPAPKCDLAGKNSDFSYERVLLTLIVDVANTKFRFAIDPTIDPP
jgi:hypothetical protein